jgi:betaine reductase
MIKEAMAMNYPVIKAAANILVHCPNIMLDHGTTLSQEKTKNPASEYLNLIGGFVRSYEESVAYAPNQVFIGNMKPTDLAGVPAPWYRNPVEPKTDGLFGEIMTEMDFYGLLKICDRFDLVELSSHIAPLIKEHLQAKEMFDAAQLDRLDKSLPVAEIQALIDKHTALGLYDGDKLLGCIRQAHESDPNLSAQVVFENLVAKASGVLAMKHLFKKHNINPAEVEYIIETSEEAVGDMNQRGGGNMAKACGEAAGCVNATGIDMRGFCAGPAHGIVNAAALVQAGIFKNVVVMAGGCTAKLGMNSRDHVNKQMPVLEDMVAGYAVLISANDGISPVIRTDIIGRHKISSGAAPQAVIQAIVVDPLQAHKLKLTDVDLYAPELQNPEITVPAGAGDVPLANYKMIGAMAVKRGEIEKAGLLNFTKKHGVSGFAPTQGHIPSGVPIIGHVLAAMKTGEMERVMVIGKGSLFLGRMTDLFDGISFIIEKNSGELESSGTLEASEDFKQELKQIVADAMHKVADSLAGR